jgi:hypothetical protein
MKKQALSPQTQLTLLHALQNIFLSFPKLILEKKMKLFCYYRYFGKRKKLIFYLNPRKTEIIFGIGYRGTDILKTFPMLTSLADEVKTSVLKIKIEKSEDIQIKAISYIVEMIVKHI